MSDATNRYRAAVVDRVLGGDGKASKEQRRAAFDNKGVAEGARALVEKVAKNAWKVTDEDVAAVKSAGVSEDQIYELCVSAALGQATRQLESALAALDQATPARADKKGA
jgi:hypothetical protein